MSRRGAVKINPVTGKMEKMDEATAAAKRDGCMAVDDRYVNAAKELGLGGGDGMYTHIKSLVRVGGGDIPVVASMEKEGGSRAGTGIADRAKLIDAKNFDQVTATMKTTVSQVGRAKVAGFTSGGPKTAGIHDHEDAFQRRKGVVNTIGGSRDVSRKIDDARLPPRGEKPAGARIMGFDTMDTHAAEGRARREAQDKRSAASSKSSGGAGMATLGGTVARAGARGGPAGGLPKSGDGFTVVVPSKKPLGPGNSNSGPRQSVVVASTASQSAAGIAAPPAPAPAAAGIAGAGAVRRSGTSNTLGGAGADAAAASSLAEKRAAFFAAKFQAQDQAKKPLGGAPSDE